MNLTRLLVPLVVFLIASPTTSRAAEWTPEAAVADLAKIATETVGKDRRLQARDWLNRLAETKLDLGTDSFVESVAHFFAGNGRGARETLQAYVSRHKTVPNSRYNREIGTLALATTNHAVVKGNFETARLMMPVAIEHAPDRALVYLRIGGSARSAEKQAREFLQHVLSLVDSDEKLPPATRKRVRTALLPRANQPSPKLASQMAKSHRFNTTALDGKPIRFDDYEGKVLLIDFWATWCGPCLRELPHIVDLYNKHRKDGLEIVGISVDRPGAQGKIQTVLRNYGAKWRQIYPGKNLQRVYGVSRIPTIFLFDRNGELRYRKLRGRALDRRVKELLAEKPSPKKPAPKPSSKKSTEESAEKSGQAASEKPATSGGAN